MNHRWAFAGLVCLIAASAVLLQSFQSPAPPPPGGGSAIYSQGILRVSIPYRPPHAGDGRLIVELVSPEDEVLAKIERPTSLGAGTGRWEAALRLAKTLAVEDLVWQRVRYRFAYAGADTAALSGTEAVSRILRTPTLHIIGQQKYLAGGSAAVRGVVTDSGQRPVAGSLRIELLGPGSERRSLFAGHINERGAAEAQFRMPAGLSGSYQLRYVADTPIGAAEFTQPIQVQDQVGILLTTEKPIYQPGQTIHARALALDRADRHAASARGLTFEVEDSRGNKVFKRAVRTDGFGIASADFPLADEVNLGTYHLRAVMDGGNISEIALNVDRYVLPKFKVAVELTGKARHGYRPGEHVTGVVRANYFFGKPVEGDVTVKISTADVLPMDAGSAQGKLDASGEYRFDLGLPGYLTGRREGAARVLVEATVEDSAGRSETRGQPIAVSAQSILLTAIPEGGSMVPSIENQVFVVASYPDGKPAVAKLSVADQHATTDESGIAVVKVPGSTRTISIRATDREGNTGSENVALPARGGAEQVLLRAERAVYRPGDAIALKVYSTKPKGAVYLDVVKDGQTVLTRDADLVNGQAELTLTATPALAGTLDLNAYVIGRDAQTITDHRLVFVQPADELKVEASTDRPEYRPGEEARVRFRVTNSRGEGVQAALGVQVVDEAVFALAEKQPGFAKVFFYLEQEAMKPRYEIHSVGMPEVVETAAAPRELAARALFAATEMVNRNRFETVAGRDPATAKGNEYRERYRKQLVAAVVRQRLDARDPWEKPVRFERLSYAPGVHIAHSAGPDQRFDTADDLSVNMRLSQAGPSKIDFSIESDRGPNNGRAEITGSVTDSFGTPIRGATIMAGTRTAASGGDGRFTMPAIPAGEYSVEVAAPGFQSSSRRFTLAPRDRAVLTVKMSGGAVAEEVQFAMAAAPRMMMRQFDAGAIGVVGGVPAGVAGGVIGGIIGSVPVAPPPPPPMAERKAEARHDAAAPEARVRSYFPEALFIHPSLITDPTGAATLTIPLADSITTWRMALTASSTRGALGSASGAIKVFQDFFADLDLPVTLTEGDRVSIPVAVYNYSGASGKVALQLDKADWFELVEDTADKALAVESGRVGGAQFTLQARRIGKHKLTLRASMTGRADIVVREIEVVPDGKEQTAAFNGRLETAASHDVVFPPEAVPEAGKIFVRLYPGPLSQVIEGMDAILRMPFGCFEQTSSATYPNVLALDYMKRTKKLTPEIRAKAEGFIATGYQRLLTYEVPGGGFSWFGNPPANKILTAYGLMEFADMAKVYEVDPRLIDRTQQWLAMQQQADGSWKPDAGGIAEGATNRYLSDVLRITAYIAWSLESTGYRGPAVEKARRYVEAHPGDKPDAYTLAVVANFTGARPAMQRLLDARTEKDDRAWWSAEETGMYGRGSSAAVETTGLAVQALLKSGASAEVARKALNYLASMKDANGAWGTTQATIMAMRAMLLSTEKGAADVRGTVEITLNGRPVEQLTLAPENNDLYHQFALKGVAHHGANRVELRFTGQGSLGYQVAGRYFVPWTAKVESEPLSIDVAYDRTKLAQDDLATATATVRNRMAKTANMVMVDLGIPPGFDLLSEDLQEMQAKTAGRKGGRLEKFNLTATQAILYFDAIPAGGTVTVKYRLRAKYPIRARTFRSRVYEYYDPSVSAVARPVQLEVQKR